MRILAISNLYPPNIVGGYEALCFDVMSALAQRGHEVVVLTSSYGSQVGTYQGQTLYRKLHLLATEGNIYAPLQISSTERKRRNTANIDLLNFTIAREKPDLVFVWNLHFFDNSLLAAIALIPLPTVYLLTDNWLAAFYNPHFIADYFARRVFAPKYRFSARIATVVRRICQRYRHRRSHPGSAIFASQFMKDLYRQAGVSFNRDLIVHHGIKSDSSGLPAAPLVRTDLLVQGRLQLLFAGRIVEIKGVHTALAALPQIIAGLPQLQVTLKIVGDERDRPYRRQLEAMIDRDQLGAHVIFAPPVAEDQLAHLFHNSDIYLFPSLYEPFSLTLIHALRAGIPTVASSAGGTAELIHHQSTGLLVPPNDAAALARQVIRLAQDSTLRHRIAVAAAAAAGRLTFTAMVDKVENFLVTVAQEH